jgi:predicted transcriptional regulator
MDFASRSQTMENLVDREYDNESLTEEDWAAIREGKEAIRRGEFVSLEEFEKDLGLLAKNIEEVTHGG